MADQFTTLLHPLGGESYLGVERENESGKVCVYIENAGQPGHPLRWSSGSISARDIPWLAEALLQLHDPNAPTAQARKS